MKVPHRMVEIGKKGGEVMRESDDYTDDIEDLLYDEEEGGPSER